MSTIEADVARIIRTIETRYAALIPAIGAAVQSSIQHGSPITGAPGQPVGQYGPGYHQGDVGGELLASYQLTLPERDKAVISTKSPYAIPNETGVRSDGRPYTQRSTVGGRRSIAMTVTNIDRLVDHVVNEGLRPEGFTDNSALGGQ